MSIVFLQKSDCPYTVHFNIYKESKETNVNALKKIKICAQRSFQLLGIFFISFKESVCRNLGSAGTSFKYIVLSKDIYLAILNTVFWTAFIGWGTFVTTIRLFKEKTSFNSTLLKQFADNEINVSHIKTEELKLDASFVPEDIKVDGLKDLFKKINFSNENAPGYMTPESRRVRTHPKTTRIFSLEELEENLEKFIQRVNTREAFLGTPAAHDLPQLMDFYQQIEDAVRLSIYKTTKDIAEFETQNGTDFANFSIEQKRKYNSLLESCARVVLDLAIAGAYCGARYMGEAMEVYSNLYNEGGIPNAKDLQRTIVEILAKKREEIAKGQIQRYLGSEDLGVDVHLFTKYMGTMGKLLGIPGTKNIIEHLSKDINTYQLLNYFLQEYTADTIIDTIQEKIKTSKTFREKITDWIKDQVKDWNHKKYDNIDDIVKRIEEILDANLEAPSLFLHFQVFQNLLNDLKKQKVVLPKINGDWENFLIELFALSESKDKIKSMFPQRNEESDLEYRTRYFQEINILKRNCSEAMLGPELLKELQDAIESDTFTQIPLDRYLPRFMEKAKIEKMRKVLANEYEIPMEQDTLARVLKGKLSLTESIQNHQELARRNEFLNCFGLEEIAEQGVSKELMEWILVSQKILKPQTKIESRNLKQVNANQILSYINVVHQGFNENPTTSTEAKDLMSLERLLKLLRTKDENMGEFSSYITTLNLSEKRYRQNMGFEKEKILTQIFNQSFQHNSDRVIIAAEKASSVANNFYPKWKKVCWIQLPKFSAGLFSNKFFKATLMVSAVALSCFSIYRTYLGAKQLFITKGIPFLINHFSLQIIQAGNAIIGIKEFVLKHSLKIILSAFLIKKGIKRLPEIPYLSAAARAIDIWEIGMILYSPLAAFFWFNVASWCIIVSVWNTSKEINRRLLKISENAEKERLMICKRKSLSVWKGCQHAV